MVDWISEIDMMIIPNQVGGHPRLVESVECDVIKDPICPTLNPEPNSTLARFAMRGALPSTPLSRLVQNQIYQPRNE